jgi:hypothetical protein
LSFAMFFLAYLFFYIPEDSNPMQFSLLLLLLYVMCVLAGIINSYKMKFSFKKMSTNFMIMNGNKFLIFFTTRVYWYFLSVVNWCSKSRPKIWFVKSQVPLDRCQGPTVLLFLNINYTAIIRCTNIIIMSNLRHFS